VANYHVYPAGDLVAHETNGGTSWLYVHHSLDGREMKEAS